MMGRLTPGLSALHIGTGTDHKRHKKDTKGTNTLVLEPIFCAFCVLFCAFCGPSLFRWAKLRLSQAGSTALLSVFILLLLVPSCNKPSASTEEVTEIHIPRGAGGV